MVKIKARIPATVRLTLTAVAFGEKEMNLSFSNSPFGFELEAQVKWVKTGRRKTEG